MNLSVIYLSITRCHFCRNKTWQVTTANFVIFCMKWRKHRRHFKIIKNDDDNAENVIMVNDDALMDTFIIIGFRQSLKYNLGLRIQKAINFFQFRSDRSVVTKLKISRMNKFIWPKQKNVFHQKTFKSYIFSPFSFIGWLSQKLH